MKNERVRDRHVVLVASNLHDGGKIEGSAGEIPKRGSLNFGFWRLSSAQKFLGRRRKRERGERREGSGKTHGEREPEMIYQHSRGAEL